MKPAPFEYHAPTTAAEAVRLLADLGDSAKPLAGGQSLVPMLSLRLAVFEHLVDLGGVEELRGIERRDGGLRIGAGTTQAAAERSLDVAAAAPLVARALPFVGHFQIRNRGTVGGSIAHADPASELPAVALALDAELEVLAPAGRRTLPASEFFTGTWTTALGDDEVLTAVTFPVWSGRCGFAGEECARRHGDFAVAGAALGVELGDDDRVQRVAIGLFGLGSTPERAPAAEEALTGTTIGEVDADEIGRLAVAGLESVPSDLHGSADYRRRVGAAMVARAWRSAGEEATRG